MNSIYQIGVAEKEDTKSWDQYLLHACKQVGSNSMSWLRALDKVYGPIQARFVAKGRNGEIVGVLPTYIVRNLKGNAQLFSPRYGLVADDDIVANLLADKAAQFAKDNDITIAEISSGMQSYSIKYPKIEKTTVVLLFPEKLEVFWDKLRDKTRNAIRKAEKNSIEIKSGLHLLNEFYYVYSRRMVEKSVRLLSKDFFGFLIKNTGNSQIYVAYYKKIPIATMFVVYRGHFAAYLYGGLISSYGHCCPNQYLLWHLVQDCYRKKISLLDLGESRPGSGVYDFKIWFGGAPESTYYYNLLKVGESTVVRQPTFPMNWKGKLLEVGLNHLPIWIKTMILLKLKTYGRLI